MHVAIIGAGNVGGALARALVRAGHQVTVTAAHRDKAEALAREVGGSVAATPVEAVTGADVVVLAVPFGAVEQVAADLGDAGRGKVVIDVTNPLTADGSGVAVIQRSAAEEIQARLEGAKVVKAFNTVLANIQEHPVVDGMPLDGFYAGDDAQAKSVVHRLLADLGFRPVDVGPLRAALSLEHLAFLNISLNARLGWPWRSAWKLVGPTS